MLICLIATKIYVYIMLNMKFRIIQNGNLLLISDVKSEELPVLNTIFEIFVNKIAKFL